MFGLFRKKKKPAPSAPHWSEGLPEPIFQAGEDVYQVNDAHDLLSTLNIKKVTPDFEGYRGPKTTYHYGIGNGYLLRRPESWHRLPEAIRQLRAQRESLDKMIADLEKQLPHDPAA
jgi:hypothetical protein